MDEMLDTKIPQQPAQFQSGFHKTLPNASAVLVLGIISLATMCMYGVPGLICGIIALSLHRRDSQLYAQDPAAYEQSFKNSKAGQVCAIIGVSLSGLIILFFVFSIINALNSRF